MRLRQSNVEKNVCPFLLLQNLDPFLLIGTLDFLSTYLRVNSLRTLCFRCRELRFKPCLEN